MFNFDIQIKKTAKLVFINLLFWGLIIFTQNINKITYFPLLIIIEFIRAYTNALFFHYIYKYFFSISIKKIKLYILFIINFLSWLIFSLLHPSNLIIYSGKYKYFGLIENFTDYSIYYSLVLFQFTIYISTTKIPFKIVCRNIVVVFSTYLLINLYQYFLNFKGLNSSVFGLISLIEFPLCVQWFIILNTLLKYPDDEKLEN